jgi:DNA-binding NarL/FixJ family response regulator
MRPAKYVPQEPDGEDFFAQVDKSAKDEDFILIIDPRALDRECLSRSLSIYDPTMRIMTNGSIEEWNKRGIDTDPSAIIMIVGGKTMADSDVCERITQLAETFKDSPVIVIADSDDLQHILKAVECGARGYIPSSVGINVAAEAIALARAGGVFIPASSIMSMKEVINSVSNGSRSCTDLFTPREIQVAEALRRGKANKIIAFEMDLCESTVKVHIRNIMKKLRASNRTEVAFKLRGLLK